MDEAADPGFSHPPRKVKPRARKYPSLPVVAMSGGQWLDEQGETGTVDDFLKDLPTREPTLFVKLGAADSLAAMNQVFSVTHPTTWQWYATSSERDIVRPDGHRMASRISVAVHYFGFKNGNFHKLIDPVTMYGTSLEKVWPGDETRLVRLLQWGVALRDFCHANGMEVRPTIGAISAQFLTDRRFYPYNRRKVPAATNENVRKRLPGNYYLLTVAPNNRREFSAWYIDQHRAHHYQARTIALPDANHLYAHGHFKTLHRIAFEDVSPDFYGLYCLELRAPDRPRRPTDWLKPGKRFVYSNELPHLYDLGFTVSGVYAAWGSLERDTGLARYAEWAEATLDEYDNATWLKPLLLSTYGVLAARPHRREAIFRLAKRGEPVTLVTGNNQMNGTLVRARRKLEPGFANVLHRGMIEAGTRSESIGLTQWLESKGFRVLAIYADGVIVENEGDRTLPPLPEPWRCKQELNHLQFVNKQAFISGEMTRLPGVSQELRKFARNSNGRAPRRVLYEAVSGRPIKTDRRI